MSEELGTNEEPRDRTKLVWGGILALFVCMAGFMWWQGRPDPAISMVRAKHILIQYDANDPGDRQRALDLISSLRERIEAGERFERLARDYSDDPGSRQRGGDLQRQRRGIFDPNFEEYVWTAEVGELSDIVQSAFGFHLIVVTERHISDEDRYDFELDQRARELQRERQRQRIREPQPAAPPAETAPADANGGP